LLPEQEGAAVISVSLSIREYGGYVVVALDGELDVSDAASIADALTSVAARDPQIIVDLAALEFIDCCALGALRRVRAQARQAGGDLLLAAPRPPVRRILALTGLIDVFSVHASVEDAVRIARPVVTAGQPAPAAGRRGAGQRYSWPGRRKGRVSWRGAALARAAGFRLAGQDGGQPGEQDAGAALELGGAVVGGE
jgi:anti-sigma B factor antagonist